MSRSQNERSTNRRRLAELTSAVGAGILGLAIGAIFADFFEGLGLALLVVGVLLHGWGMTDKHRLEAGVPTVLWSTAVYWFCWIFLAAIAVYLLIRWAMG
jgi:hypothetical protein